MTITIYGWPSYQAWVDAGCPGALHLDANGKPDYTDWMHFEHWGAGCVDCGARVARAARCASCRKRHWRREQMGEVA